MIIKNTLSNTVISRYILNIPEYSRIETDLYSNEHEMSENEQRSVNTPNTLRFDLRRRRRLESVLNQFNVS